MSRGFSVQRHERTMLIGDGCVLTSGAFAAALLLSFGLLAIFGPPTASNPALSLVSMVLMWVGGVAGVVGAWILHGRRLTPAAVVGGIAGGAISGLAVPLVAFVSYLFGLPLRLVTPWEFAGPVAVLALVALAFIAVVIWVLTDAVRDLRGVERSHVRLDVVRVIAAVLLVAMAVVVGVLIATQPTSDFGDAVIFAFLAGATGAAVVAGADIATGIAAQSKENAEPSGLGVTH